MNEALRSAKGPRQARGGGDFQTPPPTTVPSWVTGTPQDRAKAEPAANSDGEVRGGNEGTQAKAGLPPGAPVYVAA